MSTVSSRRVANLPELASLFAPRLKAALDLVVPGRRIGHGYPRHLLTAPLFVADAEEQPGWLEPALDRMAHGFADFMLKVAGPTPTLMVWQGKNMQMSQPFGAHIVNELPDVVTFMVVASHDVRLCDDHRPLVEFTIGVS